MLEIVFLGTGSSVPSKQRNLASVWMQYYGAEGESLLFDCGEGTQRQLMAAKLNFMRLDRIFISHWHADHWAGLIGLIQTMNLERRRKPLFIYAPEAERFVDGILELGYWTPRFRVIPVECSFEGDEITTVYKTKEFSVLTTPAKHSVPAVIFAFKEHDKMNVDIKKAATFGLKQGRLVGTLKTKGKVVHKGKTVTLKDVGTVKPGLKVVYTGDTQTCPTLEAIAEGADAVLHDSTFESQEETKMHAGAKQAAELAKKVGVENLVLTHFSRRYQDVRPLEETAKKIFPNTIAAKDFMKIRLKKGLFKVFR